MHCLVLHNTSCVSVFTRERASLGMYILYIIRPVFLLLCLIKRGPFMALSRAPGVVLARDGGKIVRIA